MIKYFYGIIAFFGAVTFTAFNNTENISEDTKQNIVKVDTIKRDILLEAIIVVESNGNDSCIGDRKLGRPSVGCLQIRPIMVREVNRILSYQLLLDKGKKRKILVKNRRTNRTIMNLQTTCKQLDAIDFMKIMILDMVLLTIQFMLITITYT